MSNPELLGPVMIGVSQAVASFHTLLPPFAEIRKADPDSQPGFAADVRMGEIASACITLGVGAIVATMLGNPVPMYVSAFMVGFLITLYESVLRAKNPLEPKRLKVADA